MTVPPGAVPVGAFGGGGLVLGGYTTQDGTTHKGRIVKLMKGVAGGGNFVTVGIPTQGELTAFGYTATIVTTSGDVLVTGGAGVSAIVAANPTSAATPYAAGDSIAAIAATNLVSAAIPQTIFGIEWPSAGGSFLGWDRDIPTTVPGTKTIPSQCCAYEWEILGVSSPSVMPLNNQLIPKSSTQEPSCWRVNLRNLVLPNTTLQSGSLASFYPYFYVEFSNVTEIGRQHQMVQSNNPNSKPALFRCAVTDIATPTISRFIKLTGDGMYQTVKFRPNDSLKIKVFLPDGREFMPTIPDNAPPSAPNPLVQISALFEVEHIE